MDKARRLWGPSPYPAGAIVKGIVKHPLDYIQGVLFRLPTGRLVHGAGGVIRGIPQNIIKEV